MNSAGAQARTDIARRMQRLGESVGVKDNVVEANQRWKVDKRWVTFECGCVAERCQSIRRDVARPFDPIIFRGLPEQAVYDSVCETHAASMNVYVHFGGFVDFAQWKQRRRAYLMGKVRA